MSDYINEIAEGVGAALCFLWAIYTEFRLQKAQQANEVMRRSLNDSKISDAVKSLPDDGLLAELRKDVGD